MQQAGRIRKLRWMCRRGMKELDVLLACFLDANEAELRAGDWSELERLLECEDDLLWDCLRGGGNVPEPDFAPLIEAIRGARART